MTRSIDPAKLKEKLSEEELCPSDLLRGQEQAFQRDIEGLKARYSEFVRVACPACGSTDHSPTFQKFSFSYVTCKGCRTLFMNPRPTPEIMAAYYADSENYRYWATHIFPATEASRREKLHKPWLERVVEYCRRYQVAKGTLLEVGSGFGTFCSVAIESGQFERVLGVEPTPEMVRACRSRGLEVIPKRIEDLEPGEVPSVDVMVAFEVVEHLFAPRRFLEQCGRLLGPGGLLVVSCPNGQGFDISLLQHKSLAIDAEHVNLFNPDSLRLLVESMGFEVLEISTPGRLDAEFVHEAVVKGDLPLDDPFLKRVLLEEWNRLGWSFQQFLAENGLSSHMWLAARKPRTGEPGRSVSQNDSADLRGCESKVRACYSTWSESYHEDYYGDKAAYPPVHRDLLKRLISEAGAQSVLDAGCGPASFLRHLVDDGVDVYGFDLTPEMVTEAKRVLAKKGVPEDRIWEGSVLSPESFRIPGTQHNGWFDAAVCIGVMPHISEEREEDVIRNLYGAVKDGGLVVLEARNQLFSLFTLNRYSYQFFFDELIRAESLKAKADRDETKLMEALDRFGKMFRTDLPPVRKGKAEEPGYDEVLSRAHNPLILKKRFAAAGFIDVRVLFYHYHCLPPMLQSEAPDLFRRESLAQEDPYDWRGYFMASAFMLAGKRK